MNKQKIVPILFLIIIAGAIILSIKDKIGTTSNTQNDTRLQVTTSFYPLYFFASQIGGDKANVINITPAGNEPHDYEPSPQDIKAIVNSKLLVLNGGSLETWGDKIKEVVNPSHTLIVVAGQDIINQTLAEGGNTVVDPHVWLSPPLAEQMVDKIKAGFEAVDPANTAYYEAQAQALKLKLSDLDAQYQKGLSSCTKRDFVTSHAAFGYLATAYHLNQIPIAGLSPDSEPSPRQLSDIIQLAKKDNIKYIFFESLASPKLSETIAREVGAQTLVLNPIEGLTPDDIAHGQDYFTEMQSNLINLEIACK